MTVRITMREEVPEGGSCLLSWTLEDEAGAPVPLSSLQTLTWTHYNEADGSIVNSRNAINIKNTAGGTVGATDGKCTLQVTPADNVIVDSTSRAEWRVAFVKGTANSGALVVEKEIAYKVKNLSRV
jgi:hypothetical protein